MKIKSQRDFLAGLLFITIGVLFAIAATHHPLGKSELPGPGYFPLILSALLVILGGAVLFKSLTIETEGGDSIGRIDWRSLLLVVASVAMFGLVLPQLGLFLTVALTAILLGFASDRIRWKGLVINAVLLTAASGVVFVWLLKLDIPLRPVVALGG